jgi:hypothetical protein
VLRLRTARAHTHTMPRGRSTGTLDILMRRFIPPISIALVGCASQVQLAPSVSALDTTAPGRTVADISRDLQEWHDARHPTCTFIRTVSAQVVTRGTNQALEYWTVEACDQQRFTYQVLVIHESGAIDDVVSDLDGSSPTQLVR